MEAKERVSLWDNAKFLLIFLVVLGHFADYYTKDSLNMRRLFLFIYLFHMPAFIFISGLFSKNTVNHKRYRKVFEYFFIYLFIRMFLFVTRSLCYGEVAKFSLFPSTGVSWYIFALAVFILITMCLKDLNRTYFLIFAVVLACFTGYDSSVGSEFALSRIIVYYPFFLAGYYMEQEKLVTILKKKHITAVSAVVFAIFAFFIYRYIDRIYWVRPLLTGQNPFGSLKQYYKYGMFLRFAYYLVVFLLIFCLISLIPQRNSIFTVWGQRSLQVYALHFGFCYLIFGNMRLDLILDKLFSGHKWILPAAFLVTVFLSLKFWEKVLNFFVKPKWREENEKKKIA